MKRFLLSYLVILFLATPALADVVLTVSTEYYTVEGTDISTIYNNLKNQSPLNKGTETYQAHTRTQIQTKYKVQQRGSQCQIKDAIIYLHLTYLYPKLAHSVDYKTRTWWKKFYGQLEEHELVHGEISTKAAHKLDDTLKALGAGDCINYKGMIKNRIKTIMDKMKQDQVDYDKLTEHGLKQERNRGRYP
ncbi:MULTISPECIES: DUF922 domain-containing protein [unclassified Pseudodesulfovibrio]|uniref:DUF922 domain-containing protein n=1 Tax=unclassified Pseudodesulfovibrio TaxID=2661612 RepID=UPI000FEC08DD|nr:MULTISPECIES: DUF922 domain-containing protein [unclassified Pseudodesulfovibrio]MCJ2164115.1 DUF922 domain-containing Zn-dependent protease [Pseudodesulfovibrio sp. S3-i]RWU05255.1 DUF922 domain-containing protein [Pseudodesulfovibrio sp. S3]